ncbi:MAG: pyridoxamine 5'-phosphate oxidase family protein [Actinomycetota bacterium]|nr:pyridoxamine 5'-phosphate oxidase family protein [Actinomycetota bacterium]
MALSENDISFLEVNHSAAMITIGADGLPKVARVAVALVDGKLWSSATQDRTRTKRLRRDSRCTLYVYDPAFSWLALETTVKILDGPDAPELTVQLFRRMLGRPTGPLNWFGQEVEEDDFRRMMVEDRRLIFEFDVHRTYGAPG